MSEHRRKDGEPAIGHAAKGATVGMALGAHLGVDLFAVRIASHADAGPMVEGVSQALIAAPAHEHNGPFATLPGNGSRTGIAAQGVVISFRDSLRSLAEHRGGDLSSDSRQG